MGRRAAHGLRCIGGADRAGGEHLPPQPAAIAARLALDAHRVPLSAGRRAARTAAAAGDRRSGGRRRLGRDVDHGDVRVVDHPCRRARRPGRRLVCAGADAGPHGGPVHPAVPRGRRSDRAPRRRRPAASGGARDRRQGRAAAGAAGAAGGHGRPARRPRRRHRTRRGCPACAPGRVHALRRGDPAAAARRRQHLGGVLEPGRKRCASGAPRG